MEDAKIDLIAREVLSSLRKSRAEGGAGTHTAPASTAVEPAGPRSAASRPAFHLHILSVEGGVVGSPCVIEPDKICDGSERCRSLGH
jgi:hypothetical protein